MIKTEHLYCVHINLIMYYQFNIYILSIFNVLSVWIYDELLID